MPRAVTHDVPGTTRDRLYGTVEWPGCEFTVVDTGGIGVELDDPLLAEVVSQAREAIDEADVIVFLLDAQVGPTGADLDVAELLRRLPSGARQRPEVDRLIAALK